MKSGTNSGHGISYSRIILFYHLCQILCTDLFLTFRRKLFPQSDCLQNFVTCVYDSENLLPAYSICCGNAGSKFVNVPEGLFTVVFRRFFVVAYYVNKRIKSQNMDRI